MATSQDKNRQIWLAAMLFALALVAVLGERSLRPPPRLGTADGTAPVAALQPLIPYLAVDSVYTGRDVAGSAASIARDPFRDIEVPRVAQASRSVSAPRPIEPQQSLTVSAILISDARRAAVINDIIVNLGGELPGGGRLTAVERDHVVVTDAKGGRRTLNINSGAL